MKTLNPLLMERLKELGVDTTTSSMILIYEYEGEAFSWDQVVWFKETGGDVLCEEDGEIKLVRVQGERSFPAVHKHKGEHLIVEVTPVLYERSSEKYDHERFEKECGVFTLQEVIELLPGEIKDKKGGSPYHIDMIIEKGLYKFSIRRREADCLVGTHFYQNPLDAAFDILEYIYENKLN